MTISSLRFTRSKSESKVFFAWDAPISCVFALSLLDMERASLLAVVPRCSAYCLVFSGMSSEIVTVVRKT